MILVGGGGPTYIVAMIQTVKGKSTLIMTSQPVDNKRRLPRSTCQYADSLDSLIHSPTHFLA